MPRSSGRTLEDEVRRALAPLQAEGWRLRHSLPWHGPGDIDSVAIAPSGVAVIIETKTRTYSDGHPARVLQHADCLSRRRRGWCRNGVLAMLCIVRARGVERVEADVIVVSVDRLTTTVRNAAEIKHAASTARLPVPPGIAEVMARRGRLAAFVPAADTDLSWTIANRA